MAIPRARQAGADPTAPVTGWGRADWEAWADRALAAVRPYATERHGLIHLPGPASRRGKWSDGLEGFARTFLMAGFRLARSGDADHANLAEWYAQGLAAGTDPLSPERWPTFADMDQAKVEGASIAIALHESRPWIWDRLDDRVRQRIVDWMAMVIDDPIWDNNWTWFQAIMEAFLRSVGGPWKAADIQRTLDRTESWHIGGGWYSDGTSQSGSLRNFDYYGGWALNFYPLWYCRISGRHAPDELRDRYRDRLRAYLDDAQHLVAADGSPLYQGRSLTYRFAMLAPFWAGAVFDATPLPPGRTRRLASGVLRRFTEAGCLDDDTDVLSVGWHHAFPRMRQSYSGSGSPYWASKAFAGLVLPPDHPVWTATEEPLPLEQHDVQLALPAPGWLVSGTRADGIVRVAAHGPDHAPLHRPHFDEPEYARHAYSTHTGPETDHTQPLDNHIALIGPDGRPSHRRPVHTLTLQPGVAVSRSRAHWLLSELADGPWGAEGRERWETGPWLTTASMLHGPWEVRLARIDDPDEDSGQGDGPDGDPGQGAGAGPWRLRFGGWPLADTTPPAAEHATDSLALAVVRTRTGLTSLVRNLDGLDDAGIHRAEDTNPFGPHSATPWAATAGPAEAGRIHAALITLTGRGAAGPGRRDATDPDLGITVRRDGTADLVTVRWPDGHRTTATLPAPPRTGSGPDTAPIV
ncbi:DUF2264 domain-containing protein [Streptomyces sp. NPDC007861]|uniref:DUF2264 domain-containing protein n=1 Tax=Streptomyces sp. NPDC007861 TaxID=3154893 RepID=UPI0033F5F8FF